MLIYERRKPCQNPTCEETWVKTDGVPAWLYNTNKTDRNSIIKKCRKWGQYSSVASRYLYKALDLGYTKIKFSEYKKES